MITIKHPQLKQVELFTAKKMPEGTMGIIRDWPQSRYTGNVVVKYPMNMMAVPDGKLYWTDAPDMGAIELFPRGTSIELIVS